MSRDRLFVAEIIMEARNTCWIAMCIALSSVCWGVGWLFRPGPVARLHAMLLPSLSPLSREGKAPREFHAQGENISRGASVSIVSSTCKDVKTESADRVCVEALQGPTDNSGKKHSSYGIRAEFAQLDCSLNINQAGSFIWLPLWINAKSKKRVPRVKCGKRGERAEIMLLHNFSFDEQVTTWHNAQDALADG